MFNLSEEFNCSMLFMTTGLTKYFNIFVFINEKKLGEFVVKWPLWRMNWIQIAGNVELRGSPSIHYGVSFEE